MKIKGLSTLIFLLVGALIVWVRTRAAQQRLIDLERAGGCVSCGSQAITSSGALVRCEDCGYEGRADRGGALDESALQGLYKKET